MTEALPEIVQLKTAQITSADELAVFEADTVVACDFYVTGAETGIEVPGGYRLGSITNIDHHAPTTRMARRVSSATLARQQVLECGLPGPDDLVVINHTDCDSILSAGIMSGRLAPLEEYSEAAIAADHTGAPDPIADLLQALDPCKSKHVSFSALENFLTGTPQPSTVQHLLDQRLAKRAMAMRIVADGRLQREGGLFWGLLDSAVDGELFPSLVPEAQVILLINPAPESPGTWHIKLRLGLAAAEGFWLSHLGIESFDKCYGGRWNAGSNKRGGGTALAPEAYARHVSDRLSATFGA